MSGCRHDDGDQRIRGFWMPAIAGVVSVYAGRLGDTESVYVACNMCGLCGERFSVGESNDSGEAVAVEIRAARLAGLAGPGHVRDQFNVSEYWGWAKHEEPLDVDDLTNGGERAGYLARAIVDHENGGE